VRQPAIVNVEVRIEDRLALCAKEGWLGFDPLARLLLLRVGGETRFEIARNLRKLIGNACELVDIRRPNVAAAIAEVRVTEIVGKNDDDVRLLRGGLRCGDREQTSRSDPPL